MFADASALMRVFDLSPRLTVASEISTIRNLNLTCLAARLKIGPYSVVIGIPLFRDEESHNLENQKMGTVAGAAIVRSCRGRLLPEAEFCLKFPPRVDYGRIIIYVCSRS
jgi:hypothetical protein